MFKHLPVLGAVFPAAVALWFVHPNSATATVAGVSGAAALAEAKLRTMVTAHQEGKAAKAEAKAERKAARQAARGHGPAALPPATPAPISYTAAADAQHLRRIG
jgi:hypothetical protein